MEIKPIKSNRDYQKALKRVDSLWDAIPNTPAGDELDILATLVEAWEEKYCPIFPATPIDAVKFRMKQLGLNMVDLAPYFGGKNRVSEVFSKKRKFTVKMLRELHKHLKIPAECLLG